MNIHTLEFACDNNQWQDLDSFYDSKIAVITLPGSGSKLIYDAFIREGFSDTILYHEVQSFLDELTGTGFDLVIIDMEYVSGDGSSLVAMVREHDQDVQIITLSSSPATADEIKTANMIHRRLNRPFSADVLIQSSKKALGDKVNREIGMQFFNALFGMQMCTHSHLHRRTFEHVIRTTKVYGKFLLFLNRRGYIELNSWVYKNCLMASLVHDLGKLLVMHGILYKDGKLTDYEYEQVKRHPWNSVSALLGGCDIDALIRSDSTLDSVTGYNDQNLGVQVRRWIDKIFEDDLSAFTDVEKYFSELAHTPFVHSLNYDLLYIVFRHHDRIHVPYVSTEELNHFGKILGRDISPSLSEKSSLDVVTNALTLCDMFDALLDSTRDYRKGSYCTFFALVVLYNEMKRNAFFPFLAEEFVRYVIENESIEPGQPFSGCTDPAVVLGAIENVSSLFFVTRDQESDFNDFLIRNRELIERTVVNEVDDNLRAVHSGWIDYYEKQYYSMVENFLKELRDAGLLFKELVDFTIHEIKTFDMLYRCYYSFSSGYKQRKLIEYLVNAVIIPEVTADAKTRIVKIISESESLTRTDIDRLLVEKGYDRNDMFSVFRLFDENMLIDGLNKFVSHHIE